MRRNYLHLLMILSNIATIIVCLHGVCRSQETPTPDPPAQNINDYVFTVGDFYHAEGRVNTRNACGTGSFVGKSKSGKYYIGRTNAHVARGMGSQVTLTMNIDGQIRRFTAYVGQSWYRQGLSLDLTRLWLPIEQFERIGFTPKIAQQLPLDFSLKVGDLLYSVASPRCVDPRMMRKRVTRVTKNLLFHTPQAIGGESGSELYWIGDPDGDGEYPYATYDAGVLTWGTSSGGGQGISQSHQLVQQVFTLDGKVQVSGNQLEMLPAGAYELGTGKQVGSQAAEKSQDAFDLSELIKPLPADAKPLECPGGVCPIYDFADEPDSGSVSPRTPYDDLEFSDEPKGTPSDRPPAIVQPPSTNPPPFVSPPTIPITIQPPVAVQPPVTIQPPILDQPDPPFLSPGGRPGVAPPTNPAPPQVRPPNQNPRRRGPLRRLLRVFRRRR